jgi:hypothetical protein
MLSVMGELLFYNGCLCFCQISFIQVIHVLINLLVNIGQLSIDPLSLIAEALAKARLIEIVLLGIHCPEFTAVNGYLRPDRARCPSG